MLDDTKRRTLRQSAILTPESHHENQHARRDRRVKIVDRVRGSGKNLTTVYVTHDHPDHYFGLVAIREAFPNARFVVLPGALAAIERTWKAKVDQWKPIHKDAITAAPVCPSALEGKSSGIGTNLVRRVAGFQTVVEVAI